MSLLTIFVVLVVVGVLLWIVNTYVPMAQPIRTLLTVVVVLFLVLWLLQQLGLFGTLGSVRVR